jgi:hypothetical protein
MDTVMVMATLVIRMTGLLLFVPDQGMDGRPTHVLMPASTNIPDHVAQVGFRSPNGAGCDEYDPFYGICYFDMTGYSLRIPDGSPSASGAPMPSGAFNVTGAVNRRVPRSFLGDAPPRDRVRARVTLPAGQLAERPCGIARLAVPGGVSYALHNVVDWIVSDVQLPGGRLVLQRVPLGGGTPNTILDGRVSAGESVQLFVRQVPETEKYPPTTVTRPALGDLATHMHAFYDMLGVGPSENRPIPRVTGTFGLPAACSWGETSQEWQGIQKLQGLQQTQALVEMRRRRPGASPTTVNCMVASALPET